MSAASSVSDIGAAPLSTRNTPCSPACTTTFASPATINDDAQGWITEKVTAPGFWGTAWPGQPWSEVLPDLGTGALDLGNAAAKAVGDKLKEETDDLLEKAAPYLAVGAAVVLFLAIRRAD